MEEEEHTEPRQAIRTQGSVSWEQTQSTHDTSVNTTWVCSRGTTAQVQTGRRDSEGQGTRRGLLRGA